MRIWNLQITRLRKDHLGRKMHPWELITMDQLPPEGRKLIAKIARSAAKDAAGEYFEKMREQVIVDKHPDHRCYRCGGRICVACGACTETGCPLAAYHTTHCLNADVEPSE